MRSGTCTVDNARLLRIPSGNEIGAEGAAALGSVLGRLISLSTLDFTGAAHARVVLAKLSCGACLILVFVP